MANPNPYYNNAKVDGEFFEEIDLEGIEDGFDIVDDEITAVETSVSDHLADVTDAHTAGAITNVPSGNLAATNVQAALNEIQSEVDGLSSSTGLSDHLNDTVDAHDASAISNVASGNLVATDVQAALNELQGELDTATSHISDPTDAHAASAVTNTPSGNLVATNVQAALNEIQSELDSATSGVGTNAGNLTAHLNDTVDAHDASAISNVAAGNIVATTVQAAIDELDGEKGGKDVANTWTAGQRGEVTTLTDAASITSDLAASNNFTVTITADRTLANPSNMTVGQSGVYYVVQDSTGGWTLSFGSYWKFVDGGVPDTGVMGASAWGLIVYEVRSTTLIAAEFRGPFA